MPKKVIKGRHAELKKLIEQHGVRPEPDGDKRKRKGPQEIWFTFGDYKLRCTIASKRSKYEGAVMLTGSTDYDPTKFYGWVTDKDEIMITARAPAAVLDHLHDDKYNLSGHFGDSKPKKAERVSEAGTDDVFTGLIRTVVRNEIENSELGVDVEQVNSAVKSAIDKAVESIKKDKPLRIEVKTPEGDIKDLEGVQHKALPELIKILNAGCNTMLVGPAGSGKTTLARNAANALGIDFYMTGAILQKYELLGFIDAKGEYVRSSFRDAYENGGVFLWDEIDASNPAALVAFNGAIDGDVADFPDGMVTRHKDFVAVGAANTYGHGATREYVGRNALDGATLDRFVVLDIEYDTALERALSSSSSLVDYVVSARAAASAAGIKAIISPRASIIGSQLLDQGIEWDRVLELVVFKGMKPEHVKKIKGAIS